MLINTKLPKTRWVNLNNLVGSTPYFLHKQIKDFVATTHDREICNQEEKFRH